MICVGIDVSKDKHDCFHALLDKLRACSKSRA